MWRSRIYAFVFRKVLGPYLTPQSQARLHKTLNLSLSEGRLEICDIELDGKVIHDKLNLEGVCMEKVHVERLSVALSLCYVDQEGRKVSSYDEGKVRLIASVELDGVTVDVRVSNKNHSRGESSTNITATNTTTSASVEQSNTEDTKSYFQSVLDSLKLNLVVNDCTLRMSSESGYSWISLNASNIVYRDAETLPDASDWNAIVLSKSLCIDTVTTTVGKSEGDHSHVSRSEEVCRLDGQIIMNLLVRTNESKETLIMKRDIEILVNEKIHVSAQVDTIGILHHIFSSFHHKNNGTTNPDNTAYDDHDVSTSYIQGISSVIDATDELESEDVLENHFSQRTDDSYMNRVGPSKHGHRIQHQQMKNVENDELLGSKEIFANSSDGFSQYQSLIQSHIESEESWNHSCDAIYTHCHCNLNSIELSLFYGYSYDDMNEPKRNYISVTFNDFDFLLDEQPYSQKITSRIAFFNIDIISDDLQKLQVLSFQKSEKASSCIEPLVLDSAVLSFILSTDERQTRIIDLYVQPICITVWKSEFMILFRELCMVMPHLAESHPDESNSRKPSMTLKTTCRTLCENIKLRVPVVDHTINECGNQKEIASIFARCGYRVSHDIKVFFFGLDVNDFEATLVFCSEDLYSKDEEDFRVTISLKESVGYFADDSLRFDIFALESEATIVPDAIVKFDFMKSRIDDKTENFRKERVKYFFPSVVSLKSVKSSQDQEIASERKKSSRVKRAVRGSDPSKEMTKSASNCDSALILNIPSLVIDASTLELSILLKMMEFLSNETVYEMTDTLRHSNRSSETLRSISFNCDQMTLSLQNTAYSESSVNTAYLSYMIVTDGMKIHSVLENNCMKHIRILFSDVSMYEGKVLETENLQKSTQFCGSKVHPVIQNIFHTNATNANNLSNAIVDRCLNLRKRRWGRNTENRAIFFRSRLSCPLSVDTPSFHLDIIYRCEYDERATLIFLSFYDMTHRLDIQNNWIHSISKIVGDFGKGKKSSNDNGPITNQNLTIFITVSDSNIDYISPETLRTKSRSILRVGEMRITSNILSSTGLTPQLFKVSFADLQLFVTNARVGHDMENLKLSCSKLVFGSLESQSNSILVGIDSFEGVLAALNFIRVLTLDSLDMTFEITGSSSEECSNISAAKKTISLSIGRAIIYCCKDSFLCLTETINELILFTTMPSQSDLDIMKSLMNTERDFIESVSINKYDNVETYHDRPLILNDAMSHDLFSRIMEPETNDLMEPYDGTLISDFFNVEVGPDGNVVLELSSSYDHTEDEGWTDVNHIWAYDTDLPEGQDQTARWYSGNDHEDDSLSESDSASQFMVPNDAKFIIRGKSLRKPRLIAHHVPDEIVIDRLTDDDIGASNFLGSSISPEVNTRVIILDFSVDCRFFDGFDWPPNSNIATNPSSMSALLGVEQIKTTLFSEDIEKQDFKGRQSQTYFQCSLSKIKVRLDSYDDASSQSLSSSMKLSIGDILIMEKISGDKPVKLLAEWVNDDQPRDTNDGILMMTMFSVKPVHPISSDGNLIGNEGHVTVELLPLRFFIHQVGLQFIRNFFRPDFDVNIHDDHITMFAPPPELFFPIFTVKPLNIKVDYKPKLIDTRALKHGSLVELLNVLPLEDMILRLAEVEMRNLTGWGSVISELACSWLQDISSSQMHKFLTRTTPLHPFASVGDGMKQFLMIPLEEYKTTGKVKRGLRKGSKKLASIVAYEALSVGARLTGFAAKKLNHTHHLVQPSNTRSSLPRTMGEVSDQAIESLARGLKEANTKMIIIPYREYKRTGTRGAMTSVVRGIPVAVCAPLSGAAEAVSYGLYGVRNQIRPDLREEEEASKSLHDIPN